MIRLVAPTINPNQLRQWDYLVKKDLGFQANLNAVAYGGDLFIAVGDGGTAPVSNNGSRMYRLVQGDP